MQESKLIEAEVTFIRCGRRKHTVGMGGGWVGWGGERRKMLTKLSVL